MMWPRYLTRAAWSLLSNPGIIRAGIKIIPLGPTLSPHYLTQAPKDLNFSSSMFVWYDAQKLFSINLYFLLNLYQTNFEFLTDNAGTITYQCISRHPFFYFPPLLEVKLPQDTVCSSVGRSVCPNFLKGREFSLACSYRSTCLLNSALLSYVNAVTVCLLLCL